MKSDRQDNDYNFKFNFERSMVMTSQFFWAPKYIEIRTNNYLESYHSQLLRCFGNHSNIWDFLCKKLGSIKETQNIRKPILCRIDTTDTSQQKSNSILRLDQRSNFKK
ncbi:MULE domain-containing protein [Aphis craccivora]|uniref:MULE domain-containing protein n=1 Tax=Aphis craccivora TaxID=307492 RepID=A0A6G0VWJ9_APHCR|nr:MULE domain-containing protein [Aphis craccivora]